MIKKLRRSFILINISLVAVVLIVTFFAIYISTRNQILQGMDNGMQMMLNEPGKGTPSKIKIGEYKPDSRDFRSAASLFAVQLDQNNQIVHVFESNILSVDEEVLDTMVADCLKSGKTSGIIKSVNFRYLMKENETGMKIVFADRTDEIDRLSSLIKNSLLVGSGSLFAFYFISLFLAQRAIKPIEKSLGQQKQFVADASHELKTPLTVILANADIVLSNKEKTVAEQQKWINYIKIEAQRMSTLVNDLLFLAKADDNRNTAVLSDVSLSDIVWNCILPFEPVAFEQGKTIAGDIKNEVYVKGEEGKLKQLICILIDNAIKYSNEKGHIQVNLSRNQDKARLTVSNTGNVIPPDQLEHIFERFYRIDKSRARQTEGYGLGLSIAQTIAVLHHGKITVSSSPEHGTTFTFTLPCTEFTI